MSAETTAGLADVLERLDTLGRLDRRAVLARLSAGERRALDEEMARRRAHRQRADQSFAGYSPWLTTLIEQALAKEAGIGDPGKVRAAIERAHASTLPSEHEQTSLQQALSHFLSRFASSAKGDSC